MVNNRLEAKNALLSSDKSGSALDEKLLMARDLRRHLVKEVGVYDQTKEIEEKVIHQLDFPRGFLGNLARLAGAGIITRDIKSPLGCDVNEALASDWRRIGKDMRVVVRRNSRKLLRDVV